MDYSANVKLTSSERTIAARLKNCLEPIRDLNSVIPMQVVYAFLRAGSEEGLTVTDLAARCGTSPTVASRHLKSLGSHGGGLGLVTLVPAVRGDRRAQHVFLTAQGAALVQAMIHAFHNGYPRRTTRLKRPTVAVGDAGVAQVQLGPHRD